MYNIKLNKGHYFLMEIVQDLEKKIQHLSYLYDKKGGDHYMHWINTFKAVQAFLTGDDPNDYQSNENYQHLLTSYKKCMECGIWSKEIVDPVSTLAEEVFEKLSSKLIQSDSPVGELDLDNSQVEKKEKKSKNKKTKLA